MDGEGEKHDDSKKLADFLAFREDQERFWAAYDRHNAELSNNVVTPNYAVVLTLK